MRRLLASTTMLAALLGAGGSQLASAMPLVKHPSEPKVHRLPKPAKPVKNRPGKNKKPPKETVLTGSIVQTDQLWVCKGPVDLDSVTITMTPASIGNRADEDAIHFAPGCTGRIGQLNVTQWAGDAVKATEGVHDLSIGGGSIRCLGKAPGMHQDGVQVMGGTNITFSNLSINCGRANDTLINSNLFIKRAGRSTEPPTDVVCDHCTFGGGTAHTVNIESSIRSGIVNSTVCVGKFPRLTLTIGVDAIAPLNAGNTIANC
jgi:hypothetical protein